MRKIEIVIVDNSYLAREGLKNIISENDDFTLIKEVEDTAKLSGEIVKYQPDVLIIDFTGRSIDLEDIGTILNFLPHTKVLAITPELPKVNILRALNAGVISYLLKDCSKQEITDAIYATSRGEKFFCIRVLDKLVSDSPCGIPNRSTDILQGEPDIIEVDVPSQASCDPVKITNREIEIIKLITQGNTNKQIADQLFLSTHTVNTHRKNIMSKLGVNNTAGIVMYAVKENMIGVRI